MRSCADSNLKKVSLELGGKSPLIIFDDCDIERAVRLVKTLNYSYITSVVILSMLYNVTNLLLKGMNGVFFNKGENCIAAGRIFVESSIHDLFVEKVVAETKKMASIIFHTLYIAEHVLLVVRVNFKTILLPFI